MKRLYVIASLTVSLGLSACATVNGVGKDIAAVGNGVSHVANEVRDEVFMSKPRRATATAGQACDPNPDLAGSNGLPVCAEATAPVPTYLKRRQ